MCHVTLQKQSLNNFLVLTWSNHVRESDIILGINTKLKVDVPSYSVAERHELLDFTPETSMARSRTSLSHLCPHVSLLESITFADRHVFECVELLDLLWPDELT